MALASALIGATDAAYYAADKPTMLACPRYEDVGITRWNVDGAVATAADTHADYPVQAAYDGNMSTMTKGAQAQQIWYFIAELATYHWTVDSFFLHLDMVDSNDDTAMTAAVSADGAAWELLDNVDTYYAANKIVDDRKLRAFWPKLQDDAGDTGDEQRRWTGARYFRLGFDAGAGQTCWPQINELIIGQQRQMPFNPQYPYGDEDSDASNEVFVSRSGVRTYYQNYGGAKSLEAKWVLGNSTDADKIKTGKYNDSLVGLRVDMEYGSRPFVWCATPKTAAVTPNSAKAYLMCLRSPDEFRMPRTSSVQYEFEISAVEQGGALLRQEEES